MGATKVEFFWNWLDPSRSLGAHDINETVRGWLRSHRGVKVLDVKLSVGIEVERGGMAGRIPSLIAVIYEDDREIGHPAGSPIDLWDAVALLERLPFDNSFLLRWRSFMRQCALAVLPRLPAEAQTWSSAADEYERGQMSGAQLKQVLVSARRSIDGGNSPVSEALKKAALLVAWRLTSNPELGSNLETFVRHCVASGLKEEQLFTDLRAQFPSELPPPADLTASLSARESECGNRSADSLDGLGGSQRPGQRAQAEEQRYLLTPRKGGADTGENSDQQLPLPVLLRLEQCQNDTVHRDRANQGDGVGESGSGDAVLGTQECRHDSVNDRGYHGPGWMGPNARDQLAAPLGVCRGELSGEPLEGVTGVRVEPRGR